jgi:methionyl-tRNA formyltransferase
VPLRLVFCGTPSFALPSLRRLIAEPEFQIEAVITQPDRPRGRGGEIFSSPVKDAALAAGLHVYQPEKIRSDSAHDFFRKVQPDVVAIIAYGQIIPESLIVIPRLGWINLHGSLLPKYRGAAPIQWAIVNGETRTGVTTMQIDRGLDTGAVLLQSEVEIGADETAPELAGRLAEVGGGLIFDTLHKLAAGEIAGTPQDGTQATFAPMLKKENGRIDWTQTVDQIYNRIRGLDPWPGAFTVFRGQTCHIEGVPSDLAVPAGTPAGTIHIAGAGEIIVKCGAGSALRVERVQLQGRKRVTSRDFLNGARIQPGERFENSGEQKEV